MDLWILPFPPSLGAATAGPPEASRLPSQPKAIIMRLRCYQLGATTGWGRTLGSQPAKPRRPEAGSPEVEVGAHSPTRPGEEQAESRCSDQSKATASGHHSEHGGEVWRILPRSEKPSGEFFDFLVCFLFFFFLNRILKSKAWYRNTGAWERRGALQGLQRRLCLFP